MEDELELSDHSYPSPDSSLNPLLSQVQKDIIFQMRELPRPAISEYPRPLRRSAVPLVPAAAELAAGCRPRSRLAELPLRAQAGNWAAGGRWNSGCGHLCCGDRPWARRGTASEIAQGGSCAGVGGPWHGPVLPALRWVSGTRYTEQRPSVRGCC